MRNKQILIFFLLMPTFLLSCGANLMETQKQSESYRNLGEAYLAQGNTTAALKELLNAEKIYADDPFLQNDLGLVYLAKNRPEIAIDHFTKATRLKPDYAPAMNNLGTAYMAMKNYDRAISCFEAITNDLLYATPHYPMTNLGIAYYHKKAYDRSEIYFQKALKISPGFTIALKGLAKTQLAQGKTVSAISILEDGVKKAPSSADMLFDLASAYLENRETNKALETFEKVIRLAPSTDLAKEAEIKIRQIRK
jgi:type IV pilus biogenesis/stability protein PilW